MSGSGANTIRLAKINPILGSGRKPAGASLLNPGYLTGKADPPPAICAPPAMSSGGGGRQRSRSPRDRDRDRDRGRDRKRDDDSDRRRKRKSRWGGDENDKTFIPGMPTILPTNLNKNQEEAYLIQLQIEDFSRRLRSGDLGIPSNADQRSPSPEPIYSTDGKRMNTREYRTRKRLEDDRHKLIQRMFELNPEYKPPIDYKPPTTRVTDKIVIPQEEHPDINFVGLLIGPRGNTLKSLEKESGAKIILRGKGSVKEGKVARKDGLPMPGEDEPLHAIISSTNPECVKRAVDRIKEIIRQGVEVPEDQNDLRKNQLRELALLNGTLRDQEGPRCSNCGANNHKSWQCPDKPNVTNNVFCTTCGGAGHISRDCRQRRPPGAGLMGAAPGASGGGDRAKIDEEYLSLMAELGEGPPPSKRDSSSGGAGGGGGVPPLGGGGGGGGYGGGGGPRFPGSNAGRAFDSRAAPRPLMGPLSTSTAPPLMGAGDGHRGGGPPPALGRGGWGGPPGQQGSGGGGGGGARPLLNQPPPLSGRPAPSLAGWGGPGGPRGPAQGPPGMGGGAGGGGGQNQQNQNQNHGGGGGGGGGGGFGPPPHGGMFQNRPPPPNQGGQGGGGGGQGGPPPRWGGPGWGGPPQQQQHGGPGNQSGGGGGQGPPSLSGPPPATPGPVPPPRPGMPPPQGMYGGGWGGQQQFGAPPPPPPQGGGAGAGPRGPGGRPDLSMLAQAGLPTLLAAPPPPPPS